MIHDPQNAATKTTQKEDNSKVPTCKLLYTIWQMEKIYISTAKHIFRSEIENIKESKMFSDLLLRPRLSRRLNLESR